MAGPEDHAAQLAEALGGDKPLSVPLISSWETKDNPKIPPLPRLAKYAQLFATRRSSDGGKLRLIGVADMSEEEAQVMAELTEELHHLRNQALRTISGYGPDEFRPASGCARRSGGR